MAYAIERETAGDEPAFGRAAGFERYGFIAPVDVLDQEQLKALRLHIRAKTPTPPDWHKARAVSDRAIYEIASDPKLLNLVAECIGPDLILWGAYVVTRNPGQIHPWHTDVESSDPAGGFVSVWIGIEQTTRESSLNVIAGSHRCGRTIQEVATAKGSQRGEASDVEIVTWARELEPEAELVQPDLVDGQAIIFDGRLWHGSENKLQTVRRALLLQYARPDCPIRIPEPGHFTFPFRWLEEPRAPAILVRGTSGRAENRLVFPPPPYSTSQYVLTTAVRHLGMPLVEDTEKGWRPYQLFRGITRSLDRITCHTSILSPGHCPHPPHSHIEEEILVVLDGTAELLIAESPDPESARVEKVEPGSLVYYPAFQHHTIRNASDAPITYTMLKWAARDACAGEPLETILHRPTTVAPYGPPKAFASTRLLHGPTRHLGRLHSHRTVLQPGGGYAAHADPYDVAILVLSGQIETLGATLTRGDVAFCAAGEPHGMENPGSEEASYLVFEFHAPGVVRKTAADALQLKPASQTVRKISAVPTRIEVAEDPPASAPARWFRGLFRGGRSGWS